MAAQGAPGINLISLLNPQAGAQQASIARQQALAQQLMDQGNQQQDPAQLANPGGFVVPVSPWAAAAKALEKGAGGYVQGQADRRTQELYAALAGKSQAQPLPWSGDMTPENASAANASLAQTLSNPQPQSGGMSGILPKGMDTNTALGISMLPDEFQKVALDKFMMTPDMKNNAAMGISNQDAGAFARAKAMKDSSESARPGNTLGRFKPDGTFEPQFTAAPTLAGAATHYDAQGNPSYSQIPIVEPGQPASPSQTPPTPAPAVQPPSATELPPLGIRNNNPGNVKSAEFNGTVGTDPNGYGQFATPEDGIRATALNLANQQKIHGLNTINDIIPKYLGGDMKQAAPYIEDVANRMGLASDTPLDLSDPKTLTDFTNAVIRHENGKNPYTPDQVNAGVTGALGGGRPAQTNVMPNPVNAPAGLPPDFPKPSGPEQMPITPGNAEFATKNAAAVQQRNNDIMTQAGSSPTRISDLQKLNELASSGTKFGPGADKASYYKALAQQIPGLNPNSTDAENYEVAKKYFSNLSAQYQKALGGTGTDKQLEVAMSGTPGPDMLNNAIKKVAPFLIGQEKALQAQANLRRAVTSQANGYGKNPAQDLQNVEDYWQKHYDPDVFELAAIPQNQRADYIKSLPKEKAAALIPNYKKAMEAGWLN